MIKNTDDGYGLVSRIFHWLSALIVIGLFASGLYMVDLGYYDSLYQVLPKYHKSIGILFACLIVGRFIWRLLERSPKDIETVKPWEHYIASVVQWSMFLLMIVVVILGYLISTAAGDPVIVFDWFEVPALITSIPDQADWAGEWHYYAAIALMVLAGLHALAALKHHFIDKDRTLLRMLTGR